MPIYKGKHRSMQFLANRCEVHRETLYKRIHRYQEIGMSEEEAVEKAMATPIPHSNLNRKIGDPIGKTRILVYVTYSTGFALTGCVPCGSVHKTKHSDLDRPFKKCICEIIKLRGMAKKHKKDVVIQQGSVADWDSRPWFHKSQ